MGEAAIWLQPGEDDAVAECGCRLVRKYGDSDDPALIACPLHENAEKLKEALEDLLNRTKGREQWPEVLKAERLLMRLE